MTREEAWKELKETIIELRDNDGVSTQQEICKFLANLMDVLEKQIRCDDCYYYDYCYYHNGEINAECDICNKTESEDK